MSRLSIIVPVYYNADTLEALYEDLKAKVFAKIPDYEIIFTDDGSGDDSWDVMNRILKRDREHVKCVKLSRNFGEHAALFAGLSVCTGDCAVTKQADLQEDSAIIPEMFESWQRGNDVVLAVQHLDNGFHSILRGRPGAGGRRADKKGAGDHDGAGGRGRASHPGAGSRG